MARYSSFLLRVWQSERDDGMQWSGRLEHLQMGERWQFHDLEALLAHLRALVSPPAVPVAGAALDITTVEIVPGVHDAAERGPR